MSIPSAPQKPGPKYRGFRGAALYGLLIFAFVVVLGGMIAVMLVTATGDRKAALFLGIRVVLTGATGGIAAALSRYLCGAETDRLVSLRFLPGDWGGIPGWVGGLLLTGFLTDRLLLHADPGWFGIAPGNPMEIAGAALPLRWLAVGTVAAPWWLLLGLAIGGAALGALGELGLRRAFARKK